MRIGIDGGTWGNARGYGRFTRELVRALVAVDRRNAYVLFLDPFASRDEVPHDVSLVSVPLRAAPSRAASADGARSLADMWRMSRALSRRDLDVVFFPSVYTFVPLLRPARAVVCIHDTIAERFPSQIFKTKRARLFWTLKTRAAVRQAARIATVSDHARAAVATHFRIPIDRIHVIGEAPAAVFRPIDDRAAVRQTLARLGLETGTRVVLYFGGLSPHKNLDRLLDAYGTLVAAPALADVKLIIAGDDEGDVFLSARQSVKERVAVIGADRVVLAGRLDDEPLVHLINAATVVALPSLDEGLGLPGLEAAACGTPVVATRSSALPDLLGDAALYVDPTDTAGLTAALGRVLGDEDLRRLMRDRGLARARALTWEAAARRAIDLFEELGPA